MLNTLMAPPLPPDSLKDLALSARDEFAARAMQALLGLATAGTEADFEMVAQIAYDMADAMMAQREKRP
jgi:hypothetical protein